MLLGCSSNQSQSSSPFLRGQPQSCEKGEVWGATLSPELRTLLGPAARRGSAPVIDTHSASHIAKLHSLIQSQRSVSPTPTAQKHQSELSPSELHSPAEDGFYSHNSLPVLQVSSVSASSEYRRLSDTSITSPVVTSETLTLPVPSGRRHSDISALLNLTSQKHNFAMHTNPMCQACLSLLLLRPREVSYCHPCFMPAHHCPCDFRHHSSYGGTTNNAAYGRLKGSSDCSDLSLLQQSLLNIIRRKAAPCYITPTQPSLLHPLAANRHTCSDGDGSQKSDLLSGSSVGDQEFFHSYAENVSVGEQEVTGAKGVVGYSSRQAALISHIQATPADLLTDFSQLVGGTALLCMELVCSSVYSLVYLPV